MSGLAWVRLDTAFPRNHKVLAAVEAKDGHRAMGRQADADRLVDVGLWQLVNGGWQINDWADYQQSNEETKRRKARARAAAEVRWGSHPADA